MQQVAATLVLLVTCELCLAIRVPVIWDTSASEVKQEIKNENDDHFSVESFKPQSSNFENVNSDTQDDKSIPKEYFQYTAKKPQFAVDISKFHGVQSPENHYKAFPIKPYTENARPQLGKHHLFDEKNTVQKPLQEFAGLNEHELGHVVPASSNYEVFHPYLAETPALQEIYKDPILTKIRNDLENSKNRHQAYEKDAGEPDTNKSENLESPDETDNRFIPHKNIPSPYEIHKPQRRPIYYRPMIRNYHREQYLNQRLRHPWNQYSAKIRPMHYKPVKNQIHQLRQNHALKYDDERNEYPQVHILENYSSDPKDGFDIYERGKEKFVQLRNNVDESLSKAVKENRPITYQKLEMQNDDHFNSGEDDDEEFVPIKNYAQVRKTETYKHLPRSAALEEAESYDEISNAPRLKEAVKSTKAQTVYSEEGYEDSAYDHAGEQKHASESEGHGGYLKEHELSGGKYKTPSESAKYEDGRGLAYRDQVLHAENWKNDNRDNKEETDKEDYSDEEQEKALESKTDTELSPDDVVYRNKRENEVKNVSNTDSQLQIDISKEISNIENPNVNFSVPVLDLNSTFLTEEEIIQLASLRIELQKDDIKTKYPYYFNNLKTINKHSPLRYAENLKLMPKKSKGGTEFYDSRSKFECPEVDDIPNPIPEKLNSEGHPDMKDDKISTDKRHEEFDPTKKYPRLNGLGDKIDCFKAKYFGENPLDSPFFKEEVVSNPEPVTLTSSDLYNLNVLFKNNDQNKVELHPKKIFDKPDIFDLISKLRNEQNETHKSLVKSNETISPLKSVSDSNITGNQNLKQQSTIYRDILNNVKRNSKAFTPNKDVNRTLILTNTTNNSSQNQKTYSSYHNIKDITQLPIAIRKKRSTSFIYEPYKIIKEGQFQESKKTTTSSNISPLIRQLQLSRIVDRSPKPNHEIEPNDKPVKRNINSKVYKEIDKKDRNMGESKNDKLSLDPTFIDVTLDSRRGEPRYEIVHSNHKPKYSPVENRKSMSLEEYKVQSGANKDLVKLPTGKFTSESQFKHKLPIIDKDIQTIAESSNTIPKKIFTTTKKPIHIFAEKKEPSKMTDEEDYEEYDDEEEEYIVSTITTQKPSLRQKVQLSAKSEKVPETTEIPKLKLVTRFRDFEQKPSSEIVSSISKDSEPKDGEVKEVESKELLGNTFPKFREKKKKTSKSTLVTDTQTYGDENDDDYDQKEEVDSMIPLNQDMDDYLPLYELERENKLHKKAGGMKLKKNNENKTHIQTENEDYEKNSDRDSNESSNVDEIDDDEDYDDNDHEDDENYNDDDNDDDDVDENDEKELDNDDIEGDLSRNGMQPTTPEPTKRTLVKTTDAPKPTTASRNLRLRSNSKPIVTRKKIEIHKELPVNKSSPNITQFKQDIKEVEIIKETPNTQKRKPQKSLEALELYKDDDLAKDINKLGGVEIFKEGLNLKNGPRHGGNYRSIDLTGISTPLKDEIKSSKSVKEDAVASQTEFTKHIELDDRPSNQMHGGNFKSLNDAQRSRNRGRSSKLIELNNASSISIHGGNSKHRATGRNSSKSQKLIELDDVHDDHNDDELSKDNESFSSSRNSQPMMHGGNYRSAKITSQEKPTVAVQPVRRRSNGARQNFAAILNSFVQVAPILTTTPAYILDPSKRMYYYVDA